jgi:hypothetical protein
MLSNVETGILSCYLDINNILIHRWYHNGRLKKNKNYIGCIMRLAINGQSLHRNFLGGRSCILCRTDNCVKNHFYAKLRKSLRHLNKVIKNNFKK